MSSQAEIRQAFAGDLARLEPAGPDSGAAGGQDAWLIKGDFDRFKLINDLYGCLLTDYLLDWSIEAIEHSLDAWGRRMGLEGILWNVMGDDLTIYLPPSLLGETQVLELLQALRAAVRDTFWRRYAVSMLPLRADTFSGLPPVALEDLKQFLESRDIVLDFVPRRQGYLVLFPTGPGCSLDDGASQAAALILQRLGRRTTVPRAHWNWLYDPQRQTSRSFNNGFIYPPSISFGGCRLRQALPEALAALSHSRAGASDPLDDRLAAAAAGLSGAAATAAARESVCLTPAQTGLLYERFSACAQAALKTCKAGKLGVVLAARPELGTASLVDAVKPDPAGAWAKLRWSSERRLRERLYFQPLEKMVLFQVNPVYSYPEMQLDAGSIERYRGNQHGVGLKGLNELYGQRRADGVIRRLILVFAELLAETLARKAAAPEQLGAALFVDRFTLAAPLPLFPLSEIVSAGHTLVRRFNQESPEIRLAHLRVSLATASSPVPGYLLFERLFLTGLSSGPAAVIWSDECLEVRRYCPAAAAEGRLLIESNACASGRRLQGSA